MTFFSLVELCVCGGGRRGLDGCFLLPCGPWGWKSGCQGVGDCLHPHLTSQLVLQFVSSFYVSNSNISRIVKVRNIQV